MRSTIQADLTRLEARDRHLLNDLAADAGISVDVYAVAIILAYFTLLRDAPAVLPSRPISALNASAHRLKAQG
jgi:hypothetical protein